MDAVKVDVKIGDWVSEGWELFKANMATLVVTALLVVILSGVTFGILAGPMIAGLIGIILALIDKKEPKPQIGDVFKGFELFLPTFLFVLVWGVISFVVSFVLMYIPIIGIPLRLAFSLTLSTLIMFGLPLIVEKKMDFWPASMASLNIVKANFWPFLGLYIVASVIAAVGMIACFVGIFFTLPIAACIQIVAYRHVMAAQAAAPAAPTANPAP